MTLDKYYDIIKITEQEKQDAAKHFLELAHSGKGYEAMKYYQRIHEEVRKYMRKDYSCKCEIDNLSTFLEI